MSFITLPTYNNRENISAVRLLSINSVDALVPYDLFYVVKMEFILDDGYVLASDLEPSVFNWFFKDSSQGTITTSNFSGDAYIWGDLSNKNDYDKLNIGDLLYLVVSPGGYQKYKITDLLGQQGSPATSWRVQFEVGTYVAVTDVIFDIGKSDDIGRLELYLGKSMVSREYAALACLIVYFSGEALGIDWGTLRIIFSGC